MKTSFIQKSDKKWYLLDAKNQVVGRLAVKIVNILRGKSKVFFAPHQDVGDHVIVINTANIKLTGNKLDQKKYYSHSGYLGHLKEETAKKVIEKDPNKILFEAVKGMLPKNRLRNIFLKKLRCFRGAKHTHEAQNPILIEL